MSVTKVWCLILSYCLWNTSSPFTLAYSKQQSKWGFSEVLGCRGSEILFLLPVPVPLCLLAGKKRGKMFINTLHNQNDLLFQAAGCYCMSYEDRIVRLGGKAKCLWPPSEPDAEVGVKSMVSLSVISHQSPPPHCCLVLWSSQVCGLFACCLFLPGE